MENRDGQGETWKPELKEGTDDQKILGKQGKPRGNLEAGTMERETSRKTEAENGNNRKPHLQNG
jgi:hypothetical protein